MKRNIYIFILAALGTLPGRSQIAAWDFYGQSFPVTCAATTFDANLVAASGASDITRGPGAPASGGVHSFRTTGFQNNGISLDNTDYFQVTLQPAPGYSLSLATIDAKFNGTSTFFTTPGVTSQYAYSLDGISFTLIGNPVQSPSLTMTQVDLTGIPDLQHVYNGTTVTMRYYASGQTSTGGWGFYSASAGTNGLAIGGVVEPAVITAPTLQASAIVFSNVQQTQTGLSWTPGNGERRIVKINTVNSFADPVNGTDPMANPVYNGSGEQVIYNGWGNSLPVVTGLTMGVTYWFRVFEYNGSGALTIYNTMTAPGNPANQTTPSQLLPPVIISPFRNTVSEQGAILGGHITSTGGTGITERGTVWSLVSPVTLNDHRKPEGGTDTGYFSHPRDTLPPASLIRFAAYATNQAGSSLTPESSFFTLATEPAGHVSSFQASGTGPVSVMLSWDPAPGVTDGYLIIRKEGIAAAMTLPSDTLQYDPGELLGDGMVAARITNGITDSVMINGLIPGTVYTFSIFPFNWDGAHAPTTNYRTVAPIPSDSARTALPGAITYHWSGATGTDWTAAANWNPARTVPAPNDILVFDIGGIWTIVNVPSQTIGQIRVLSYTGITLKGSGTLVVGGDDGDDLAVTFGSHLNLSGSSALLLSLGPSATGSVSGEMTFSGGAHRLLAASPGSMVFQAGSQFKAGSGFSGNPFGTTNLNSVVFASGSAYVCQAGGNPFGATAPASVVVFQPGSLYRLDAYVVPSFGGRTYGNFEMNFAGSITVSGSTAVSIGNFTASQGTFCFNMTGNPGHSIRGDIFISSLATLIFTPASAGTVLLNGTVLQHIHGFGSLMAGTNSTISCTNTEGVRLEMNATVNNLTINGGAVFTIAPGAGLTVNGNLVNSGPATGLILESDGSLIHHTGGVSGTIRRDIGAADWTDWQDGWHFLASPVAGQVIGESGGFVTTGAGNDYDFYLWSESFNRWVNFKNTGSPPFFASLNGNSEFLPGRGYLVAYQQPGTREFTGVINNSDLPVTGLTRSSDTALYRGWNLLGNPYPCALTWYTGWNAVNIGGVAQVWNELAMSYSPRNAGEPIPACNGFMVQVLGSAGASGSLTIPAARRVHSQLSWFKETSCPVIRLFAGPADGSSFQESQVRLDPRATAGFDSILDGGFLPGYAPWFYSVCGSEKLSVNCHPPAGEEIAIPFHFTASRAGRYRVEARFTDLHQERVLLTDRLAGVTRDLSKDPVYLFTASPNEPPYRFRLIIYQAGNETDVPPEPSVRAAGGRLVVSHSSDLLLELFDLSGKMLFHASLTGSGREVLPVQVSSGLYLVRMRSSGNCFVSKVIIQSTL